MPLGSPSPADRRRANERPTIRDIQTGIIICHSSSLAEEYMLQYLGRAGYIDSAEIGDGDETYEVFTYRLSHTDQAEVVAYRGYAKDLHDVRAIAFPHLYLQAAE